MFDASGPVQGRGWGGVSFGQAQFHRLSALITLLLLIVGFGLANQAFFRSTMA